MAAACGGLGSDTLSEVRVENVSLQMPQLSAQPARIVFDIEWPSSFRDELNRDALWLFVKFREPAQSYRHARLVTEPTGHRVADNNGVLATLQPSDDGLGVFLYRAEEGFGAIDWDGVSLSWDLSVDGVARESTIDLEIIALQMVYVPEGPYLLGDGTTVDALLAAQFESGTSGRPHEVTGETEIVLGGGSAGSIGNNNRRTASDTPQQFRDDFSTGDARTLPASFPKGYAGFYVMKNELTQGDYARFLNLLDASQQVARKSPPATSIATLSRRQHRSM